MKRFPWVHLILFLLTLLSTVVVGAYHEGVFKSGDPLGLIRSHPWQLAKGLPFSFTLLTILLCHEFAHYLASRAHHVEATLPYFIPAPTFFGTLGAFIKMKSPIATRNALVDIGASGPIAGFIVSVIASVVGLLLSEAKPLFEMESDFLLGPSLLFYGLIKLLFGNLPPDYGISMHAVAFAGWIGFLVTSLNLIPVGQLDGGHIAYAFLGDRHAKLSKILIGVLVLLGVVLYEGWLVWAVLLLVLGLRHPPIASSDVPMDSRRKYAGAAAMIIFFLTFMPVPIVIP